MPRLAALAGRFPATTVCIDHAGFPRRRDAAYFREWHAGMALLAQAENTVVKISGFGQADHTWTIASLRNWVDACLQLWGPHRAFFGTNWPVDRLRSSYGDVIDAYAELVAQWSASEQRALFAGNADRIFRLG